jgi:hypothetical protein
MTRTVALPHLECKERDQKIFELEQLNHHLADTLKLLPEGKTPEQLKQEWHVEQEKKDKALKIVAKLKNENSSGLLSIFKRKNKQLIDELEKTMMTSQVPENPLQE